MNTNEWRGAVDAIAQELNAETDWSGRKHGKITFSDGASIGVAKTPSDHRALKNIRSQCEQISGKKTKRAKSGKLRAKKKQGFRHLHETVQSEKQTHVQKLWAKFLAVDEKMQAAVEAGDAKLWEQLHREWVWLSEKLFRLGVDTPDEWMVRSDEIPFVRRHV